jgi:type II secretory pathway pseudopilin PulG
MNDPNTSRVTGTAGPSLHRLGAPNQSSRFTFHVSRSNVLTLQRFNAFTLLELLVVISIIILIAAIAGPVVGNFKPNVTASATRQLLDDIARARQLAISQHTTVYMIFCPTNFWTDPATAKWNSTADWPAGTNLFDKQLIGYTFVSLHTIGDQPGRPTVRYLAPWRTLPEGAFITPTKFALDNNNYFYIATNGNPNAYQVRGFSRTGTLAPVPFPLADTLMFNQTKDPYVTVPFIAFDYLGRLLGITPAAKLDIAWWDELIPVAKGSVGASRDPVTKLALASPPSFTEMPPGNSSNAFNIIVINHLTGRAHLEHAEVQ